MKSRFMFMSTVIMALIATLLIANSAFAEGEEPPPEPAADESVPAEEAQPQQPADAGSIEIPTPIETPAEEVPLEETPSDNLPVEEPPAEETPAIDPPTEEIPAAEVSAEEPPAEQMPTEELPLEDPLAEDIPTAEVPAEEIAAGEIAIEEYVAELTDVPAEEMPLDGIPVEEIVLIDEAGLEMDLASQATAEALKAADPYFTTGAGVNYYRFLGPVGACALYSSFYCADGLVNPIQEAINYIEANGGVVPDSGAINVEKATYPGNVLLDQSQPNLTNITWLNGMPDGSIKPTISGTLTIRNLTTSFRVEVFNVTGGLIIEDASITTAGQIFVNDVTGPVTIRDSVMTNGHIDVTYGSGTLTMSNLDIQNSSGYGIRIEYRAGNITMTNVKSSHNDSFGAAINNPTIAGNVTINNCAFDYNSGATNDYGLGITSIGIVTINGLSASHNGEWGLLMSSFSNLSLKNAVLTNNAYDGIFVNTTRAAPVLLENIISRENGAYGLNIVTAGAVTLRSVDAHANHNYGIWIDATSGTGAVSMTNIRIGATFVGIGSGTGLRVHSRGAISISSIVSHDNQGYGVWLDNCQYSGSACTGSGNVSITSLATAGTAGANAFYNNTGGSGLYIDSRGAVILTNLDAYSNSTYGVQIYNARGTGGVTINKNLPNWENGFADNKSSGILIESRGAVVISDSIANHNNYHGLELSSTSGITLTNVGASENGLVGTYYGLYINNGSGTGSVTIRSSVASNYMDFSRNLSGGISITCLGSVSVSNVNVTDNMNASGLYIENYNNPSAAPTVAIANGFFYNNYWNGITVYSKGAITLTNVEACDNDGEAGVRLDNYTFGGSGGVTIRSSTSSAYYYFSNNRGSTGYGILILSRGAVSVSNAIAEDNKNTGISINNANAVSDLPVSMSNSRFSSNDHEGISVNSRGAITLTNVSAVQNGSGYYGAYLNNTAGAGATGVAIRSTAAATYYEFSGNSKDGIHINSEGPVSVGNVISCRNGENGLYIDRNPGTGAISVVRSVFEENGNNGLVIYSTASAITLTDVSANLNDPTDSGSFSGAIIDGTYGGVISGSVTINSSAVTRFNEFSSNSDRGLAIGSYGPVSISNVIACGNDSTNIDIYNSGAAPAAPKPVSLTRTTASDSESAHGISIATRGSVTLNSVIANNNATSGLTVDAYCDPCAIPANVAMIGTGNEFIGNKTIGINISTEGNISLMNVTADGTTSGDGIYLYNYYTGSIGNVTISASGSIMNSSCGNYSDGLQILSKGTISISRLIADDNGAMGGNINNSYANPLIKIVTLTSCEFNRNRGSYGLYIWSEGAVALNSTSVESNERTGLYIETDGAVTLNGVHASFNSFHEADVPSPNASIHERLTSDAEGDIWYFTAAFTPYTITLSSTDFDAFLSLYHWDSVAGKWEWITDDDNSLGGTNARIIYSLTNTDDYYILATTADGWGQPGEYTLGFNGAGTPVSMNPSYGVYLYNSTGTSANVTITSPATFWSVFKENNAQGLEISTNGAVSITNATIRDNGADGASIYGNPKNVTIRNTSTTTSMWIANNRGYGIYLPNAYGNITLSGRIFINSNSAFGAYLNNSSVPVATPMYVTISAITADSNQSGDGLYITSIGQVTLSNVHACFNDVNNAGVYIYNASGAGRGVTINGTNIFNQNDGNGLEVTSSGIVSISGVRVEANSSMGMYVNTNGAGKSVTLTNIIAQYNKSNGVEVHSDGQITLTNVRSNLNGKYPPSAIQGTGIIVDANNLYHIYFNNCSIIGNVGNGIWAESDVSWIHLAGTNYFGNNTDGTVGDYDFWHY